jgi:hypothetical protein
MDQRQINIPLVPFETPCRFYEISHDNSLQNFSFESAPDVPLINSLVVASDMQPVVGAVVPYVDVQVENKSVGTV